MMARKRMQKRKEKGKGEGRKYSWSCKKKEEVIKIIVRGSRRGIFLDLTSVL